MSDERFKLSSETVLQYQIMDNDTDLNESEVVDLLNRQDFTIEVKQKYIEKLEKQLEQIPKNIRKVWLED